MAEWHWIDPGALINVGAPGYGRSRNVFIVGYSCTQRLMKELEAKRTFSCLGLQVRIKGPIRYQ